MSMRLIIGGSLLVMVGQAPARAEVPKIAPGMWQSTIKMSVAPNPKLPPEIVSRLAQPRVMKKCITPEMATRAAGEHFGADKALNDRHCMRSGAGFAAGRIDQTIICHPKDGGVVNVHMTGSYTPTSTHMVTDMQGTGKHMMMQKMTVDSQRIGDCTK